MTLCRRYIFIYGRYVYDDIMKIYDDIQNIYLYDKFVEAYIFNYLI